MKWCPECCTQHETRRDCPGTLLATGTERYGQKITIVVDGRTEVIGVLIAEAGEVWRARVMTYPNMLWSVPGGRGAMKFAAGSAQEAEARAVAFVTEHCKKRGYAMTLESVTVDAGPIAREAAAVKSHPRGAVDPRHPHALSIRFGETRPDQSGTTSDLSSGGLLIATSRPIPKGRKLRMLLDLGHFTIPLSGQVVWVRVQPEKGRPVGMGVELRLPPTMYVRYVKQMLDAAEQTGASTETTRGD